MKLHDYLLATKTSDEAFARLVGKSAGAVRKWRYGERVPRPVVMTRIREATNGAVTADDFLPAPEPAE